MNKSIEVELKFKINNNQIKKIDGNPDIVAGKEVHHFPATMKALRGILYKISKFLCL